MQRARGTSGALGVFDAKYVSRTPYPVFRTPYSVLRTPYSHSVFQVIIASDWEDAFPQPFYSILFYSIQ